ncbi:MAG: hypothetical protein M0Z53_00585 [Thermaerobacter sp.]|nr:hypothetical protein [Thermaerobacter sp.]
MAERAMRCKTVEDRGEDEAMMAVVARAVTVPAEPGLCSRHALVVKAIPADTLGLDGFVHAVFWGWIAKDREWNVWYLTPSYPGYHGLLLEHLKNRPAVSATVPDSGNHHGVLRAILAATDLSGLPKVVLREARRLGWVRYDLRAGAWFRTSDCPATVEV